MRTPRNLLAPLVKIHIDIESPSEEGRAARRQVLMLIAAYGGGKAAYMATLEDLVNALVRGTADPVVPCATNRAFHRWWHPDRVRTCKRAGRI